MAIKGRFLTEYQTSYNCEKRNIQVKLKFPITFETKNHSQNAFVLNFSNGFATVLMDEIKFGTDNFAKTIEEYLGKDSEFISKLCEYVKCDESDFKGITVRTHFENRQFNIRVKKEEADVKTIINLCVESLNEDEISKFKELKLRERKEAYRRQIVHKKILEVVNNNEIEFKNSEAKKRWNIFFMNSRDEMPVFMKNLVLYLQYLLKNNSEININKASINLIRYVDEDGYGSLIMTLFLMKIIVKTTWKYGYKI